MTPLNFRPVDSPDPEPPEDYDDGGCTCPPGDNRYKLSIEEGGASLIHTACGKPPSYTWGDWRDLVEMPPIPVTVEWETRCNGSPWHGMDPCDCDHWIQTTPDTTPETAE